MKLNEYGMKCFAVGEEVTVNGKQYRFVEIVPNGYNKCALYSEGQERARGFCGECSGCGSTFPEGTVRGRFEIVNKVTGAQPTPHK